MEPIEVRVGNTFKWVIYEDHVDLMKLIAWMTTDERDWWGVAQCIDKADFAALRQAFREMDNVEI